MIVYPFFLACDLLDINHVRRFYVASIKLGDIIKPFAEINVRESASPKQLHEKKLSLSSLIDKNKF